MAQDRLARVIPSMHVHLCVALWLISLHPSPVFYFVPPLFFQPFQMSSSEFHERFRSNPLCDFRLGTVATSDHETSHDPRLPEIAKLPSSSSTLASQLILAPAQSRTPLQLSTRPWLGRGCTPQVQGHSKSVHVGATLNVLEAQLKPATIPCHGMNLAQRLSSAELALAHGPRLTFGAPSWKPVNVYMSRVQRCSAIETSTTCECLLEDTLIDPFLLRRDVLIASTWTRPSETWTRSAK